MNTEPFWMEQSRIKHDNERVVDAVITLSNYGADAVDAQAVATKLGWTLDHTQDVLTRCINVGLLDEDTP